MKRSVAAVCFVALVAVFAPILLAQWPAYPNPNVPKTPDGKPDLSGPTPRTKDGHPDFSGLWTNNRGQRGGRGAAAGARGAGAPAPDAPVAPAPAAPAAPPATLSGPPLATFGNVGAGFPEGLPFQPWAADLVKKRQTDFSKDNPDAHCLPMGFMQFHTHGQPRKIVQTPNVMVMIFEPNHGLRQIFTDGRALPNKDDVQPWWYGYSVGKWEGDTLVVQTTGFIDNEPLWLDVRGSPMTNAATVTEKFRRPNFGMLEIEVTVDDPKAYTKPWTVKLDQRIMVDAELIEFICEDRDATHYVGGAK
jgi:hypothetical protein